MHDKLTPARAEKRRSELIYIKRQKIFSSATLSVNIDVFAGILLYP